MKRSVLIASGIIVSALAVPTFSAEPRAPRHVSADQAIACIKSALSAKPGNIREMEAKRDGNKTVCEVEVIASDGKKFEVSVDVATGKVLRVAED